MKTKNQTGLKNFKPKINLNHNIYMYLWFNFIPGSNFIFLCFKLIIKHNHTQEQRKITFEPRIKLNHNIYNSTRSSNQVRHYLHEELYQYYLLAEGFVCDISVYIYSCNL